MYIPDHFRLDDRAEVAKLIAEYGFGILVSVVDGIPIATHIPFMVEVDNENLILLGHVVKANPHWQSLESGEALVIFQGPHSYISPTWYSMPGVPTWNYAVVHIYGTVSLVIEHDALHQIVLGLSDQYERNREDPWIPDYDSNMLNAIVGLEIRATRVEGKYKINQNRSKQDRKGVIEALALSGTDHEKAMHDLMKKFSY
jgi:transcriptional regulator